MAEIFENKIIPIICFERDEHPLTAAKIGRKIPSTG